MIEKLTYLMASTSRVTGSRSPWRLAACAALTAIMANSALAADLTIAMPNWTSGQASANILKVGIEREFGLDVDVIEMGTLIAFGGLQNGSVHVHPEVWQPNLNNLVKRYVDEAKDVVLSPQSVPAWQGICANRVAADKFGIKDIADLSDINKMTALDTNGDGKGEVWIGAPGWSSTPIERIRANSYGYSKNLDLLEVEEDVGMAAVDAAESLGNPIVFACYAPHAVFRLHDIVRLSEPPFDTSKWNIVLPSEDPAWFSHSSAAVGWDKASYRIAYASDLKQNHPEIARFLDRVDFTPEEAIDMSYALQVERQLPLDYAKAWVETHGDRVKGWAAP